MNISNYEHAAPGPDTRTCAIDLKLKECDEVGDFGAF